MKIAFTGDLVLQDVKKSPEYIFSEIRNWIDSEGIELISNLESPFIKKGFTPTKNKITLYCYEDAFKYLNYLKPKLINLSNNHVNDYGNESVILTKNILSKNNINNFGVGLKTENEYLYIDEVKKIIYLSFSTRSSDLTENHLFASNDIIGPYEPTIKKTNEIIKKFPEYIVILNLHWGIEDISYPEPSKINLAHNFIDIGVDLIIGHHPHIVQPIEKYRDKYIFYSVGNFYFDEIYFGKEFVRKKPFNHQKKGIIPVFKIFNKKIILDEVKNIKIINKKIKFLKTVSPKIIKKYNPYYDTFFYLYKIYNNHLLFFKKIVRKLNL